MPFCCLRDFLQDWAQQIFLQQVTCQAADRKLWQLRDAIFSHWTLTWLWCDKTGCIANALQLFEPSPCNSLAQL